MTPILVQNPPVQSASFLGGRRFSVSTTIPDLSLHAPVLQTLFSQQYAVHNQEVERTLGETEASYFLPSRESGVNDMYLHLGCIAPVNLVKRPRISLVWAIMRVRHPLLASSVKMNSYENIVFSYRAPQSPEEAIELAERSVEYRSQSKDDLIDSYLNGARILSNERLSYLIISSNDDGEEAEMNHDFLICATHFLGDGMALHQFASDFFTLLGSTLDEVALREQLMKELSERCLEREKGPTLPSPMEERLPKAPSGGLSDLASRVDFRRSQEGLIGGHTFPRKSYGPRKTIVPTVSFNEEKTTLILANCKRHGVSISSALFAICNVAWARTQSENWEWPIMMYSALNMRPHLRVDKRLNDSYWFLAIGYFNVVLPSFFPRDGNGAAIFWHRAMLAKTQSTRAAKNPMAVSRCFQMAKERGQRARVWAKEDDEKAAGTFVKPPAQISSSPVAPKAPSNALMGLSLLGNLDGIYKHANFPNIKLHTLTTGSRQRSGGMLLFGYTFAGKLWVSFGYDKNGFEEVIVQRFWKNVIDALDEFLLN